MPDKRAPISRVARGRHRPIRVAALGPERCVSLATEENAAAEKIVWHALGDPRIDVPAYLGAVNSAARSTPLAITQMIPLHHLLHGATSR